MYLSKRNFNFLNFCGTRGQVSRSSSSRFKEDIIIKHMHLIYSLFLIRDAHKQANSPQARRCYPNQTLHPVTLDSSSSLKTRRKHLSHTMHRRKTLCRDILPPGRSRRFSVLLSAQLYAQRGLFA